MISANRATLYELDNFYGAEDLYMLLEIIAVDRANARIAAKRTREG